MAEAEATGGQATAGSTTGTTAGAPVTSGSVTGGSTQTTGNGPDAGAIESFFDPASIADKPELVAAYKQMQSSYTKRMQDIAKHRPKIDAYDKFERDPLGTLKELAQQYGYQFVQRGTDEPKDWNPQSWDDVMARAKEEVRKEMQPVFNEVKNLKKQNVESYLDNKYPDWREHEEVMMEKLRAHPSLVTNPDDLYTLALPAQVREARATKAALQKLKSGTEASQVSGGSSTTKQTTQEPSGPLNFNQAVEVAKARLAAQGVRRSAG